MKVWRLTTTAGHCAGRSARSAGLAVTPVCRVRLWAATSCSRCPEKWCLRLCDGETGVVPYRVIVLQYGPYHRNVEIRQFVTIGAWLFQLREEVQSRCHLHVMASICYVHFRSLAACTPSCLKAVTRSACVPLRLTGGGGSLTTEPINSSFVLRPFTIMPTSVACWTSSSTNNYMLLIADLLKNSVIVVSSTYLCVRQSGCSCSASIKMINVSGPRYDPCGMPADSCNQSDRMLPIFIRCRDLSSLLQKGGHPPHNDVRQTQSRQRYRQASWGADRPILGRVRVTYLRGSGRSYEHLSKLNKPQNLSRVLSRIWSAKMCKLARSCRWLNGSQHTGWSKNTGYQVLFLG